MSGPRYAIKPEFIDRYPGAEAGECYELHTWHGPSRPLILSDAIGNLIKGVAFEHLDDCGMIYDNPIQKIDGTEPSPIPVRTRRM